MLSSWLTTPVTKKQMCRPQVKAGAKLFKSLGGRLTVELKNHFTLNFVQYSKLFTTLRRVLKASRLDKARLFVPQFRLVPAVKHAVKSRMGKGKSKFVGYA